MTTFAQALLLAAPVLEVLWDEPDSRPVLFRAGFEDEDAFQLPFGSLGADGEVDSERLGQPWLLVDKLDGAVYLLPMLDGLARVSAMRPAS